MSPTLARDVRSALRAAALCATLAIALFMLWPLTAQAAACIVPSGPYPTIQSAIDDANCDPINVGNGTFTEALSITRSVNISGTGATATFVNGNNNSRPLTVDGLAAGIVVSVQGLTVYNGNAIAALPSLGSGGIYRIGGGVLVANGATLLLENARVTGNRARGIAASTGGGLGGGIGVYNQATLHATNVTIDNNIANVATHGGFGGGIAVLNGRVVITGTNITANVGYSGSAPSGDGLGGGIYMDDDAGLGGDQTAQLSLNTSNIYSNTAIKSTNTGAGVGGGLYVGSAKVVNINSTGNYWYGNQARSAGSGKGTGNGGAIGIDPGQAAVVQALINADTFYQNIANAAANLDNSAQQAQGGAIYLDADDSGWLTATLTGLLVYSNTAQSGSGANTYGQGGGIWARLARVQIERSLLSGNAARSDGTGQGGAIYADSAQLTTERSKLSHNRAEDGGVLYLSNGASEVGAVDLTNLYLVDNQGGNEDVYINNANPAVTNQIRHVTLARQAPVPGQSGFRTAGSHVITGTLVASYTLAYLNTGGSVNGTHNLFFGNTTDTTGSVNFSNPVTGDPSFVNPAAYDYHIRGDSAARDAGIASGVSVDFDGQPRDATPDIGADEYHDQPVKGLSIVGPSTGLVGNVISFTVQITSGTNVVYTWDFGDGGTGNGESVNHTYAASGVYTASVTARNAAGTEQAETVVYVGDALVDVGPGGQDIFSPRDVTIPAGGTVVWTLRSGLHSVTADDGSFLQPLGSTWAHYAYTFPSQATTLRYYCEAHGAPGGDGMAGTVTVESDPPGEGAFYLPVVLK